MAGFSCGCAQPLPAVSHMRKREELWGQEWPPLL